MAEKTGIEWILFVVCPFFMTRRAYGLDIKPMTSFISSVMVILSGWFATIKTWQHRSLYQSPSGYSMIYSPTCLMDKRLFSRFFAFSGSWSSTGQTSCFESVSATGIFPKHFFELPSMALPAKFISRLGEQLIFLKGNTGTFCCYFGYSNSATHDTMY